jgi:hypothetical protein
MYMHDVVQYSNTNDTKAFPDIFSSNERQNMQHSKNWSARQDAQTLIVSVKFLLS